MELSLAAYGFKSLPNPASAVDGCILIQTKRTLNINRAVAVIKLDSVPVDMKAYVKEVRGAIARKAGFFPFFYSLGIQLVLICPDITSRYKPLDYVAMIDNQWAIIQSVFFVDPKNNALTASATWGQFITGKYQRKILYQLDQIYHIKPQVITE